MMAKNNLQSRSIYITGNDSVTNKNTLYMQRIYTALSYPVRPSLSPSCLSAGIISLGAQFAKLRIGLKHLNFSKTSLSPKGTRLLHVLT